MMRKTNEGSTPAGVLLPAGAAGLLTTLLLMLVGAVLVHRGTLAEGAIAPCAWVFLAAGTALAGLIASKRAGGCKLLWGAWCRGRGFSDPAGCGADARLPADPSGTRVGQPALHAGGFGARRPRRRQYAQKETA